LAGDRVRESGAHGRPQVCGGYRMKGVLQQRACALGNNVIVSPISLCKGVMVASVVGQWVKGVAKGISAERFPSTLPTSLGPISSSPNLQSFFGDQLESITLSELRTGCLRNCHVTFDIHETRYSSTRASIIRYHATVSKRPRMPHTRVPHSTSEISSWHCPVVSSCAAL
jgi:hypothetical protein